MTELEFYRQKKDPRDQHTHDSQSNGSHFSTETPSHHLSPKPILRNEEREENTPFLNPSSPSCNNRKQDRKHEINGFEIPEILQENTIHSNITHNSTEYPTDVETHSTHGDLYDSTQTEIVPMNSVVESEVEAHSNENLPIQSDQNHKREPSSNSLSSTTSPHAYASFPPPPSFPPPTPFSPDMFSNHVKMDTTYMIEPPDLPSINTIKQETHLAENQVIGSKIENSKINQGESKVTEEHQAVMNQRDGKAQISPKKQRKKSFSRNHDSSTKEDGSSGLNNDTEKQYVSGNHRLYHRRSTLRRHSHPVNSTTSLYVLDFSQKGTFSHPNSVPKKQNDLNQLKVVQELDEAKYNESQLDPSLSFSTTAPFTTHHSPIALKSQKQSIALQHNSQRRMGLSPEEIQKTIGVDTSNPAWVTIICEAFESFEKGAHSVPRNWLWQHFGCPDPGIKDFFFFIRSRNLKQTNKKPTNV